MILKTPEIHCSSDILDECSSKGSQACLLRPPTLGTPGKGAFPVDPSFTTLTLSSITIRSFCDEQLGGSGQQ